MKSLLLIVLLSFASFVYADVSTAFLVVRADIENQINQIDASTHELANSLVALERSLDQLASFKNEVFHSAFESIEENRPLNGLALTKIHSYLKIHLLILERGLALADFAKGLKNEGVENQAMAVMALSLLEHKDVYLDNDRLRNLLDKKDQAYEIKTRALHKAYERLTNKKIEKEIRRAQLNENIQTALAAHDKDWKRVRRSFRGDFWQRFKTFVVHHISGGIGNMAGAVKFRKGLMWDDSTFTAMLQAKLEPMDIITERTPFILTDHLIPGHFGHNALWLGTEMQLKELGIWNTNYMKPFQQAILEGYNIIETDRSGTHLKRLKDWMNIDEVAVIRRQDRPTQKRQLDEFYAVLMAQYGKTYDFNFDVETTDKLVCSELIYQSYGDVIWPTKSYLGRFTISPDNVAEIIAQKGSPFKLIYSLERNEQHEEIRKDLVLLTANLGYSMNGIDDQGQKILEKSTETCIDRVNAAGETIKSCLKTWLRPVFGGTSERRFEK